MGSLYSINSGLAAHPRSRHSRSSPWTPSGRRCSLSRLRQTPYTRPSLASRRPLPRPSQEQTRLTAISGTTAKRSSSLRLASTRPMTSSPRPPRPLIMSSRPSRLLREPASTTRSPLRSWTRTWEPPSRWPPTMNRSWTNCPKLGVQEAELKRAVDRAELAEKNLKGIEEELETVGENMKQLEKSAEKALEREEKLVEKIYSLQSKYKTTEAKFEYGEMNITKLNQRIDDIEDEIYREKLKIKKSSDELDDTFDDMMANY